MPMVYSIAIETWLILHPGCARRLHSKYACGCIIRRMLYDGRKATWSEPMGHVPRMQSTSGY